MKPNAEKAAPPAENKAAPKSADKGAKPAGKKAAPKPAEEKGGRGRKAKYADHTIHILKDGKPMREGSKGAERFKIIKDGMTYEKFVAAGGRAHDLAWDIQYKRVEVRPVKK